ncbi:PilZ domain-containing protein [Erythrobacteraceae bacterium WH01K]|nr:PilZ domain-containing protein [Erythrobacteraceae bacterium WH01K]
MSGVDTRHIARDSLFLMADLQIGDGSPASKVKVRNLSNGGMMAECDPAIASRVQGGTHLSVQLRNIGWVEGTVAWVQDNRFGIAFSREIDAADARARPANTNDSDTPRYVRPAGLMPAAMGDPSKLRKI